MKYIFIAYANERMAYSLKRIGRQARKLGLFDEIILYTPDSLPESFRNIELMQHRIGGGYWAWKPYIIWETLQHHDEGDVVCYVDAGCTLHKTSEWNVYIELMKRYDNVLFSYPDEIPQWESFGTTSTIIKHWAKKTAVDAYDEMTGGQEWRECNKVLGGFIWAKGRDNVLIREWLDIVMNRPDLIKDPDMSEEQYSFYVRHKHDQPAVTALTYKYRGKCLVLPELLDEGPRNAAVVATRIRANNLSAYIVCLFKLYLRRIFGDEKVDRFKSFLHI